MTTKKYNVIKNNEQGMALLEAIPLLLIFLMFFKYGIGLFGSVHGGILNSISARSYLFETLRNRTNTTYFRDTIGSAPINYFANPGNRFHTVTSYRYKDVQKLTATETTIDFTNRNPDKGRNPASAQAHVNIPTNESLDGRNRNTKVDPIWLMIGYGMCFNPSCGD